MPSRFSAALIAIFALTIFTGSSLLFLVQPMFAKLVLPRLGGSASVWNTCVLFFQTTLLLGYVYAHVSTKWLGVRRQAAVHLGVLLLPLAVLPLSAGTASPEAAGSPVWWLLATMSITVGLPFFVVSTTAPLLQRWFATLPVPSAGDPYFLYSASNAGSMIALLGYPFLLEPSIAVSQQTFLWTTGYVFLGVLTAGCAGIVLVLPGWRPGTGDRGPEVAGRKSDTGSGTESPGSRTGRPRAVTAEQRARWLVLSFVPSSLMLGATMHVSSDIAPVPLMWVLPLALYLLTFVLAFAGCTPASADAAPASRAGNQRGHLRSKALSLLILATLVAIFLNIQHWAFLPLHLATFFLAALACHSELAARRPHVAHLTEFYLWMSFGGMLGGVFNTLVAPQIFATVLEYPLMLALVALVGRGSELGIRARVTEGAEATDRAHHGGAEPAAGNRGPGAGDRRTRTAAQEEPIPVIAAVAVIILFCGAYVSFGTPSPETVAKLVAAMAGLSLPIVFANRRGAFGTVALAFVVVLAMGRPSSGGSVLFVGRSFFGMHRVVESADGTFRTLHHGSTVHGRQQLTAGSECQPTTYYAPASPVGQLFSATADRANRVGIIGLGSGVLACYAKDGEPWTFYEIDPMVEWIARNPSYFTQLRNSRGSIDVVLGDGRITLQRAHPSAFDILIVDAFSSDSIPVHLLTREALQLYLSRVAPGGIVALHVSNRYLDLEPMLGTLARGEGLHALANLDITLSADDLKTGRLGSHWLMIAREPEALSILEGRPGWRAAVSNAHVRPWTDDYSNILAVLRWKS